MHENILVSISFSLLFELLEMNEAWTSHSLRVAWCLDKPWDCIFGAANVIIQPSWLDGWTVFKATFLHYQGWIGPGTTWTNEMKLGWNIAWVQYRSLDPPHCSLPRYKWASGRPSSWLVKHKCKLSRLHSSILHICSVLRALYFRYTYCTLIIYK